MNEELKNELIRDKQRLEQIGEKLSDESFNDLWEAANELEELADKYIARFEIAETLLRLLDKSKLKTELKEKI